MMMGEIIMNGNGQCHTVALDDTQFRQAIREARNWLEDAFPEQAEDVADLWPSQVRRAVTRHYEGGWEAFLADAQFEPTAFVVVANVGDGWEELDVADSAAEAEYLCSEHRVVLGGAPVKVVPRYAGYDS